MIDQELNVTRRAWPESQRLLESPVERLVAGSVPVSWHESGLTPEGGATAVVRINGPLTGLVGEVIRVQWDVRPAVFVYVLGQARVLGDLSLSRRAYLAAAYLAAETLPMTVEVCE